MPRVWRYPFLIGLVVSVAFLTASCPMASVPFWAGITTMHLVTATCIRHVIQMRRGDR